MGNRHERPGESELERCRFQAGPPSAARTEHRKESSWEPFAPSVVPDDRRHCRGRTGSRVLLVHGRHAGTDDAYIRAAEVSVSTDVSGIVNEVDVKEGQAVKAGDILFRIELDPYRNALDAAAAALADTSLNIDALKINYQAALRNISAQQAVVAYDQLTADRYSDLAKDNLAITQAQYDAARLTLAADKEKLASLEEGAKSELAQLMGNRDIATEQHPQYLQAKAQLDEAQRQLDHTVVRARFDGTVTRVDDLQPGVFLLRADRRAHKSGRRRPRVDRGYLGRCRNEGDRSHLRQAG